MLTPFARARGWLGENNSLIGEIGVGACRLSVAAEGHDQSKNSLTDTRSALLPLMFAGGGYGYRGDGGFRLAILIGYMQIKNAADPSVVTTTGVFSQADRDSTRKSLDKVTDVLAQSRAYVELDLGWSF